MHQTREILQPQASVSCSITVYVCVSNIHAGPHFMLGSSTNSRDFKRFLEEIRWARTDSMDRPYTLVLNPKTPKPLDLEFNLYQNFSKHAVQLFFCAHVVQNFFFLTLRKLGKRFRFLN